MWHWFTENMALYINLHQAGLDRISPKVWGEWLEAWTETRFN